MTNYRCYCGRPSPDAFLCGTCTNQLERTLGDLPALLADLDVVRTRQDRADQATHHRPPEAEPPERPERATSPFLRGKGNRITLVPTPSPVGWSATNLTDEIHNTCATWIRHLCETRGVDPAALFRTHPDTVRLTRWLLSNLEAIRQDEAASGIHSDLTRIPARVARLVDNRDPQAFCGPCDAPDVSVDDHDGSITLTGQTCGADLMANFGETTVTCQTCSTVYDVADRQEFMRNAVRGMWATAQVIADGLTSLSMPLTASMIRQMKHRGEIFPLPKSSSQSASYYLVGDVMDVLLRRAERKAARPARRKQTA